VSKGKTVVLRAVSMTPPVNTNEAWDITSTDWTCPRPMPEVDEIFAAEAIVVAAGKKLDEQIARLQRTRGIMRRTHAGVLVAIANVADANELAEQALRELAKVKDERR
jgi:hypothetical protein